MAVLGLHFCARALSSCGKWGPLLIAVRGPLTTTASPVAEHRLQTHRLSNCGSQAQLLRGMWDPPRPGLEPVSPALAGRLSTTAPPGNPCILDGTRILSLMNHSTAFNRILEIKAFEKDILTCTVCNLKKYKYNTLFYLYFNYSSNLSHY